MARSLIATALAFVVACVVADLRARRIPNLLSVSAGLAGIVLNTGLGGTHGLLGSIGGLAATISLLLVPFVLGGIGGGDVKMMGAVGALLGLRLGLIALAIGTVAGGVVAAVHLARRGRLRETLRAMCEPGAASDPIHLPYSAPLALGTIAAIAMVGVAR